jgi:hypothetical protein
MDRQTFMRSAAASATAGAMRDGAVDRGRRGRVQQAGGLPPRRRDEGENARRPRVSTSLRRSVVDGAAETLREAVGASVLAFYHADYKRAIGMARTALGQQRFESCWTAGVRSRRTRRLRTRSASRTHRRGNKSRVWAHASMPTCDNLDGHHRGFQL